MCKQCKDFNPQSGTKFRVSTEAQALRTCREMISRFLFIASHTLHLKRSQEMNYSLSLRSDLADVDCCLFALSRPVQREHQGQAENMRAIENRVIFFEEVLEMHLLKAASTSWRA